MPTASRAEVVRHRLNRSTVVVSVASVVVAVTVGVLSNRSYDHNESRLLSLEASLTADTLLVDPLYIQAHLGTAVQAAQGARDPAQAFRREVADLVGPSAPFAAASLWSGVGSHHPGLVATVGTPTLPDSSPRLSGLLVRATSKTFSVEALTTGAKGRLAYAMAAAGPGGYVAYSEEKLPAPARMEEPKGSPIQRLDLAVYLGSSARRGALIESRSRASLPLPGQTVTRRIPFGDRMLTLVMASRGSLLVGFAPYVPWGVGAVVLALGAGIAAALERMVRRRQDAERAFAANGRLLSVQSEIAHALQHSMLPETLPTIAGWEATARYLAAAEALEVGGDWYDLVKVCETRLFFSIGDVSGHGLKAAALMGTLRNVVSAYGREGHGPSEVLALLSPLVDVADGEFATVLCGVIDVDAGELQIANAGHPPPLLVRANGNRFLEMAAGTPIGVRYGVAYGSLTVPLRQGDVLVAFTDGLVERRGEDLTQGLERLRSQVADGGTLDQLVDHLLAVAGADQAVDDVAVLALRCVAASPCRSGGDGLAGGPGVAAAVAS